MPLNLISHPLLFSEVLIIIRTRILVVKVLISIKLFLLLLFFLINKFFVTIYSLHSINLTFHFNHFCVQLSRSEVSNPLNFTLLLIDFTYYSLLSLMLYHIKGCVYLLEILFILNIFSFKLSVCSNALILPLYT